MDKARIQLGTDFAHSRDRDIRPLSLFVAASVVLHVALAALLPQLRSADVPPQPLQVMLEKPEPPPVTPAAPMPSASETPEKARPKPRPKAAPQKKIAQPEPQKPAAPSPAPPQVLALPQVPDTPPVTAPMPQSDAKPTPVAPREEQVAQATPGTRAPRTAPPSEAPAPAKTTAPISDAAYLQNPQPRYPMSARRRGEQGTVLLKVLVTREGTAASVNVETSSGSTSLDEAALEAVRRWRFVPAKRGAQPVEAWHLVPIVFRLEGTS
jgi:protein TonB